MFSLGNSLLLCALYILLIRCPQAASISVPYLEPRHWQSSNETKSMLQAQWENPNNVLDILLILGGDIVQKALAQLAGGRFVPVAFSFGWVSYSFEALSRAIGMGNLMPSEPDDEYFVVNAKSGYCRPNRSWMLGRVLRDIEHRSPPIERGLYVAVFRAKKDAGLPVRDGLWYSGVVVMVAQIALSVVPYVLHDSWAIFMITCIGTLLALAGGALPQWKAEKWACRRNSSKTFSLTRGNGHNHVFIVDSIGIGLDLEDLAIGKIQSSIWTRLMLGILAFLWIVLLIVIAGLDTDTWYLLAIGFMGMVQNIVVAGSPRSSSALGIHLEQTQEICEQKIMNGLIEIEKRYPRVGLSLLKKFFPGELHDHEKEFWDSRRKVRTENLEREIKYPAPSLASGPRTF